MSEVELGPLPDFDTFIPDYNFNPKWWFHVLLEKGGVYSEMEIVHNGYGVSDKLPELKEKLDVWHDAGYTIVVVRWFLPMKRPEPDVSFIERTVTYTPDQ